MLVIKSERRNQITNPQLAFGFWLLEIEMKTILRKTAIKKLLDLYNRTDRPFFSVTFVKRTPPYEQREMKRAQFGVKKHLKGGERAYDPFEKNLLCVFDHDAEKKDGSKGDYRSINLDQIIKLKIDGEEFVVKGAESLVAKD